MDLLQGAGRICPPHVCVIQKTPCGIGLKKDFFEVVTIHWLSDVRQKMQGKKLVTEILFDTG